MTTVTYHIQERATIGGVTSPWRTVPLDWISEEAARAALNYDPPTADDGMEYRIVRVTTEVRPCPAEGRTGAGPE